MEARLVPKHGIEMSWVRFGALRGLVFGIPMIELRQQRHGLRQSL